MAENNDMPVKKNRKFNIYALIFLLAGIITEILWNFLQKKWGVTSGKTDPALYFAAAGMLTLLIGFARSIKRRPVKTADSLSLEQSQSDEEEEERPRCLKGVVILGIINLVLFGLAPFISLLCVYFMPYSTLTSMLQTMLSDTMNVELSDEQFKQAIIYQIIISVPFIVMGLGVLLRKNWARKLTAVFSFTIVVLVFISALFNPAIVKDLATYIQIAYFGILIIYFTNKNVAEYFSSLPAQKAKKTTLPAPKKIFPGAVSAVIFILAAIIIFQARKQDTLEEPVSREPVAENTSSVAPKETAVTPQEKTPEEEFDAGIKRENISDEDSNTRLPVSSPAGENNDDAFYPDETGEEFDINDSSGQNNDFVPQESYGDNLSADEL